MMPLVGAHTHVLGNNETIRLVGARRLSDRVLPCYCVGLLCIMAAVATVTTALPVGWVALCSCVCLPMAVL